MFWVNSFLLWFMIEDYYTHLLNLTAFACASNPSASAINSYCLSYILQSFLCKFLKGDLLYKAINAYTTVCFCITICW